MKKLISLLLSAVMTAGIFTAVPTGAVAAEKQVSLKKSSATLDCKKYTMEYVLKEAKKQAQESA